MAAVAGFPLGAAVTSAKVFEAAAAVADGAQELDFVVNVAALKEKDLQYFCREIKKVRAVSKEITLKVILEASLLDEKEKIVAARAAADCGADMLKTSTGFFGGVTIDDVKLLKEAVPGMPVKASGGIRTANFALELLEAGAERLGTSSACKIIGEYLDAGRKK